LLNRIPQEITLGLLADEKQHIISLIEGNQKTNFNLASADISKLTVIGQYGKSFICMLSNFLNHYLVA